MEMHRQIGKSIHDACQPGKTPFRVAIATPDGLYIATVRRKRKPKAGIVGLHSTELKT